MSDREQIPHHIYHRQALFNGHKDGQMTDRQMGELVPGGMRLAVIRDQAEGARALQVMLCLSPSLATVLENPTRPILAVWRIATVSVYRRQAPSQIQGNVALDGFSHLRRSWSGQSYHRDQRVKWS